LVDARLVVLSTATMRVPVLHAAGRQLVTMVIVEAAMDMFLQGGRAHQFLPITGARAAQRATQARTEAGWGLCGGNCRIAAVAAVWPNRPIPVFAACLSA
jgi:hypothetical protein